ncbi:MAG: hypothetical protein H6Q71_2850 [Firmicutes bacterium]|nr:hypothetical protein [Bacillota bacterium]
MDTDINNVFEGLLECPQLKGFVKVPNIPRKIIDNTSDGILKRAVRIILSVYDKDYVGGKWVINEEF